MDVWPYLMLVGAIYVFDKMVRSGVWLWKRLQGASGSHDGTATDGLQQLDAPPAIRALKLSDDESWSVLSEHEEGSASAGIPMPSRVTADELRTMMAQNSAAVGDPYNKMHGRVPNPWVNSEEEDNMVTRRQSSGDQLPRRRKKKGGKKSQLDELDDDAQEAILRQTMKDQLLGPMRRLYAKDTSSTISKSSMPPSGLQPSSSSMSSGSMRQSGSSSQTPMPQSGLEQGTSSSTALRSKDRKQSQEDGSHGRQAKAASLAASAASSAAGQGTTAMSMTGPSGSSQQVNAERPVSRNLWNEFQHAYQGRHWGTEKMRAEFWKMRSTGKWPK